MSTANTIPRDKYEMYPEHREAALAHAAQRSPLTSVDRLANPDPAEFRARYIATNTPAVVTGVVESSRIASFGIDEIAAAMGDLVIKTVESGGLGPAQAMRRAGAAAGPSTISLTEYIDLTLRASSPAQIYAANMEVPPGLEELVTLPAFFPANGYSRPRLWLAPAGVSTAVHFDFADNLHGVFWGKKRFSLGAPSRTQPSELIDVELGRGDMLYIPACWWHGAINVEPSFAASFFATRVVPGVVPAHGGELLSVVELLARMYEHVDRGRIEPVALHGKVRALIAGLAALEADRKAGRVSTTRAIYNETDLVVGTIRALPWIL